MRINYMSDLHLEFAPLNGLPGGDMLILAGDITLGLCLNENRSDNNAIKFRDRTKALLDEATSKYDWIMAIAGNHEYYNGNMQKINKLLSDFYCNYGAIYLKDGATYIIDNLRFIGGTKWTDFDKENPVSMRAARRGMNDFHVIKFDSDIHKREVRFLVEDAVTLHKETIAKFKKHLKNSEEEDVIMITHHAPSGLSANLDRYGPNDPLNGAYFSDQSNLILDNPNIKYWIHGHMHSSANYKIGECNVLANPRGYIPYGPNRDFLLEASFEI